MERFFYLLKKPQAILISFIILIAIAVFISLVYFSFKQPSPLPSSITPTVPPPTEQLSAQEKNYSEAPLQPFPSPTQKGQGILVVTSDPSGARILIDVPEADTVPKKDTPTIKPIPVKITPFKMSNIPAGTHTLSAYKEGYLYTSQTFTIEANEVTRVEIKMLPISMQ